MKGRKIILGVTGSIAAYKSTFLLRRFVEAGAEVKVLFTPSAHEFVTPLTFSTLSGNPVETHLTDEKGNWNNHVKLGLWADLFLVAPLSATTAAKMAQGIADNLLTAVYLSAKCPVILAPAMDLDMFRHGAVKDNLDILKKRGNIIVPSPSGFLASGLSGEGRMEEPEKIFSMVEDFFFLSGKWKGKKVLVTAGPTYEKVDPVRFIGNYSSGKMGTAIAQALLMAGAEVKLVCGPGVMIHDMPGMEIFRVESAIEMEHVCSTLFPSCNGVIMAAAVADFRPAQTAAEKIKKSDGEETMRIELLRNPDILAGLSAVKSPGQFVAGFALETQNGLLHAKEKLSRKNLDVIFLNSPGKEGTGFGYDTNSVTLISKDGLSEEFPLMEKRELANKLVHRLFDLIYEGSA
jgi:phosphopantothenoylcysteine decarboxylase/phosphopantothenate--cysteine ligase